MYSSGLSSPHALRPMTLVRKNGLNLKSEEHICIFSLDQLARSHHKPRILRSPQKNQTSAKIEAQDRNQFVFNQYSPRKRTTRAHCGRPKNIQSFLHVAQSRPLLDFRYWWSVREMDYAFSRDVCFGGRDVIWCSFVASCELKPQRTSRGLFKVGVGD